MNEQAITALCDRLGTTVENLMPRAIEYGLHAVKLNLTIAIIILAAAILLICLAVFFHDRNDDITFITSLAGGIALIVACAMVIINVYDLHMWKLSPELSAYKMLLSWLSS